MAGQSPNMLPVPKVLVLASDAGGVGGIERATRTLARACMELFGRRRVRVISVWRRDGLADLPCDSVFSATDASSDVSERVPLAAKLRFAAAALRTARRWRPRIVVMVTHPHLAPVAWACRLLSGAPYAVWCHGYETWGRLPASLRLALRRADALFAPSEFSARGTERAAGLPPGRVKVIPHSLPPEVPLAPDGGRRNPRVLTVARLDPRNAYKGVDTLIHAFPMVRARMPEAELVVVGDGPDRQRLEAAAYILSLDGHVTFAGRVGDDDLVKLYSSSAVFALPARASLGPQPVGEGFGIVYCEAQAAGLAVVAGAAGAAAEVVEDGVTGVLVDPSDAKAVADAIADLLSDPERARRMGQAGVERVAERFSYARFRNDIDGLIRGIARGVVPRRKSAPAE